MALSQCLDDSPLRVGRRPAGVQDLDLDLQEVYNERHRLALEELLAGGSEPFLDFLRRERIPNFLSDEEMQRIGNAAVLPRCASLPGEEALEQSVSGSMDCSSLTYFPEVSDVEPPLLELGWPGFTSGSYRGVTRAVAHFQPSYGDKIYGCKEAVRRLIRSSREVIAIVTDSLTDLDIFKDLQEASSNRRVPVYILLDQSCAPAFLKMCRNVGVRLDDLQQMRVRTITGTTYYMRSGARITGEVHERFMLIDGNRVATGSYRYDWTDGKLNSSNLVELSGQVTEKFDEEFRILYAQSLPLNTRGPLSVRHSSVYEHLLVKNSVRSSPHLAGGRQVDSVCLTSTPSRKPLNSQPPCEPWTPDRPETSPVSDCSTMADQSEAILAGSTSPPPFPAEKERVTPTSTLCHTSTQTSRSVMDSEAQTDLITPTSTRPSQAARGETLSDSFHKLSEERQRHYSSIRSKLEVMMCALSQRRELADVTNVPHSRQRVQPELEQQSRLLVGDVGMGSWPRGRCVHGAGRSEVERELS